MLYSANKKLNSTKRLSADVGYYARFMCNMNVGSSLLNMTITLNPDDKAEIFTLDGVNILDTKSPFDSDIVAFWKYAYSYTLKRWYIVTDIVYNSGLWYMSLSVDVLATYRDSIGKSVQLVSRCEKLVEPWIDDSLMPITQRKSASNLLLSDFSDIYNDSVVNDSQLYYLVSVNCSENISARGMLTTYVLNYTQLLALNKYLMEAPQTYMGAITDVTDNMLKALINPLQYIVSVKAYCFKPETDNKGALLKIGFWNTNIATFGFLKNSKKVITENISIPNHPQYTDTRKYLNQSPYTTVRLDFLPFYQGTIDTTYLQFSRVLYFRMELDMYTGDALLEIMSKKSEEAGFQPFLLFSGNISIDIPVSQIMSNNFAGDVTTLAGDMQNVNAQIATMTAQTTYEAAQTNANNMQAWQNFMNGTWGMQTRYVSEAFSGFMPNQLYNMNTEANRAILQDMTNTQQSAYNAQAQFYNVKSAENTEKSVAAQNMYSAIAARMPIAGTKGYYSSLAIVTRIPAIYFEFWEQSETRPAMNGRPWFHYDKIEDCGGYCEVVNPVTGFGLAAEDTMIERFMSNGFFYE